MKQYVAFPTSTETSGYNAIALSVAKGISLLPIAGVLLLQLKTEMMPSSLLTWCASHMHSVKAIFGSNQSLSPSAQGQCGIYCEWR